MALRKEEYALAKETWMRMYKAGTPVPASEVIAGTLVIAYEKDPMNFEEWENYFPLLIVGHNKKSARTAVMLCGYRSFESRDPLSNNTMVVPLSPYVHVENDNLDYTLA